jgi:hypothetical protein
MSAEINQNAESFHEWSLDPFAEPRFMPGSWDLSALPAPVNAPTPGSVKAQSENQAEADPEKEAELSRQTLADWHLEPYFDPKPSPNSDLSAF